MAGSDLNLLTGGFWHCTQEWRIPEFIPDFCKLYSPISGSAVVECGDQTVAMDARFIYFIPPFVSQKCFCPNVMDVHWIHFQAISTDLKFCLSRIRLIHALPKSKWMHFSEVYAELPAYFEQHNYALGLRISAMLIDMIGQLASALPIRSSQDSADLDKVKMAIEFMDQHFQRAPDLAEIADASGLSPTYFHRVFSRLFHFSPRQYVLQRRMSLACQLLRDSSLPIKEIAGQCGFESVFAFSRAFRREHGNSPTAFRALGMANPLSH